MKEYDGGTPKNARIRVNYEGLKPIVRFSYPKKRAQREGSMLPYIFAFWYFISLIFFMVYSTAESVTNHNNELKDNSNYNLSNYEDYKRYFEDKNLLNYSFESFNQPLAKWIWKIFFTWKLIWIIQLITIPLIIYLPFKKFWKKVYPDFMAATSSKKLMNMKPKDVIRNERGEFYCEIPLFNNVVLDYKATEDFSRFMTLFEIKEHNFTFFRKKRKVNECLWYARFYFKAKPEKGELKVLFK